MKSDVTFHRAQMARNLSASRRLGVGFSLLCFAVVVVYGEPYWRVALVSLALVVILASFLVERRLAPRHRVGLQIAVIQCAQFSLVAATGGLQSPILVPVPVTCFLMAMALGHRRHVPLVVLPYLLGLGTCLWLELAGVDWVVFELLSLDIGTHNPLERGVYTFVLAMATIACSVIGFRSTRLLDGSVREAMEWQAQAIEVSEQRAGDLQRISGALAHELKNPLTAIQGLSSFLAERAPAESAEKEQLQVVVGETHRMREILDRLLNIARPPKPGVEEVVLLASLIGDIVKLHSAMATSRGVIMDVDVDDGAVCVCDPRKVQQILLNLLQNALEVSPEGSRVRVSATASDEATRLIQIEDEGPGLPELAEGESVFDPGITARSGGTGLGLTIARTLAEQQGAVLVLENKAGSGCVASLTLMGQRASREQA